MEEEFKFLLLRMRWDLGPEDSDGKSTLVVKPLV